MMGVVHGLEISQAHMGRGVGIDGDALQAEWIDAAVRVVESRGGVRPVRWLLLDVKLREQGRAREGYRREEFLLDLVIWIVYLLPSLIGSFPFWFLGRHRVEWNVLDYSILVAPFLVSIPNESNRRPFSQRFRQFSPV